MLTLLVIEATSFGKKLGFDICVKEVQIGHHAYDPRNERVIDRNRVGSTVASCAGDEIQHGPGDALRRLFVGEKAVVEDGEAGGPDALSPWSLHAIAAVEGYAQVANETNTRTMKLPTLINRFKKDFVCHFFLYSVKS